jgi:hypothetical protein
VTLEGKRKSTGAIFQAVSSEGHVSAGGVCAPLLIFCTLDLARHAPGLRANRVRDGGWGGGVPAVTSSSWAKMRGGIFRPLRGGVRRINFTLVISHAADARSLVCSGMEHTLRQQSFVSKSQTQIQILVAAGLNGALIM